MTNSNSQSYLHQAGLIFKGEMADLREKIAGARSKLDGASYKMTAYLVCHFATQVFAEGYSKLAARRGRADLMAEFGLKSEKQADKYSAAISAALGVRGMRVGVQPIEGLDVVAADGPDAVMDFLKASDIKTFNQFMSRTRAMTNPLIKLAQQVAVLNDDDRKELDSLVIVARKRAAEAEARAAARAATVAAQKAAKFSPGSAAAKAARQSSTNGATH